MAQKLCTAAAAVRLAIKYPFWTEVFFSMNVIETTDVETEATDGVNLYVNPSFFSKLKLDDQVTELVHELCHKIFLHMSRRGHREPRLWNVACDYAANSLIKKSGHTFDNTWLYDAKYDGWLAETIYADLLKRPKPPEMPGGRTDIIEVKGTPEEVERFETEVQATVDRAVANGRAMGNLPAGIEQGVVEVFKPSKEPWYNKLHRYMQSMSTANYNWARTNRRALQTHGVFAPSHFSRALGDIAVFLDTSGSCFQRAQQQNFAGHLNAILAEAKPKRVHVYYFDTKVYPGETIEAGELDFKSRPKGGGGTDFRDIFDALERESIVPEVCIILTDLMGTFPNQGPEYPVLWCNICQGEAPFGETILVDGD